MMRRPADVDQEGSADQEPLIDGAADTATVTLHTNLGQHVGATLANDIELQAVIIQHLHPNDLGARGGLRPGDAIVALNDVPVSDHTAATQIMDDAVAKKDPLAVTYLRASAASSEREKVRSRGDGRATRERKRWIAWNILSVVFIFWWLRGGLSRANDFDISPEQIDKLQQLQKLALHDARNQLALELTELGGMAIWLADNSSHAILDHLESTHAGAMVQMLRAAMFLNTMLNATSTDQKQDAMQLAAGGAKTV